MKKHDINIEFNNHNDIYNALENLRKEEWLNIKEIKVPKITYQV
jgi:RNA recognition motif-containing protein